jgi:hypothetical protein
MTTNSRVPEMGDELTKALQIMCPRCSQPCGTWCLREDSDGEKYYSPNPHKERLPKSEAAQKGESDAKESSPRVD